MIRSFLTIVLLSLVSCGYNFQGSGSILPADVKTVEIPLTINDTVRIGIGEYLTEQLRTRFDQYGAVKVVERDGDAILKTRITKVERSTSGVSSKTNIALEGYLTVTISAELRKRTGQLLWRRTDMQITENFAETQDTVISSSSDFASGSIDRNTLSGLTEREVSRGQQEQTLETLLDEAARRIYLDAVAPDF
jgi:outer membrane lipopolysaccharide assembly protein LptE/RlpB